MSRSKAKGTAAETAVADYLQAHGFPAAERRALHGGNDRGDITGIPGIAVEVKAVARPAYGEWLREAHKEAANAGVPLGVVIHKDGRRAHQARRLHHRHAPRPLRVTDQRGPAMTLRIEPGPTDDDNRWPCCEHCHEPWSVRLTPFHHDEPCEACRKDPAMSSHPCCEHCDHIPPHRRDDHDEACPECRLPPRMTCGGCAGLGAHTRWCPTVVGVRAHQYGITAAMLDDCGDMIGATDPGLANRCWALADQLTIKAETAAELHKAGQA